jgi:hypothetical protein
MQFLASFKTKFKQIPKEVKLLDQEARVEENTQKGAKVKKKRSYIMPR